MTRENGLSWRYEGLVFMLFVLTKIIPTGLLRFYTNRQVKVYFNWWNYTFSVQLSFVIVNSSFLKLWATLRKARSTSLFTSAALRQNDHQGVYGCHVHSTREYKRELINQQLFYCFYHWYRLLFYCLFFNLCTER